MLQHGLIEFSFIVCLGKNFADLLLLMEFREGSPQSHIWRPVESLFESKQAIVSIEGSHIM